jgi:hypothetical protein
MKRFLSRVGRREAGLLALAAAAGGLIAWGWPRAGLPPHGAPGDAPFPGLWAAFFALGLPAGFAAFTAFHVWLRSAAPPGAAAGVHRGAWWDGASYAVLPLFPVLMLAGRATGEWRWILAASFVVVVLGKTALAVTTLYRALVLPDPSPPAADPPALGRLLVAVGLLPYALLAPYVAMAVSTGGDEPVYLLNVESLRADGDVDIGNNVARGDAARFYWGPPPDEPWSRAIPGFAALLLPGYTLVSAVLPHYPLAGRLGAILTITLAAALLARQTYALCRDLGASRPAAFWTWLLVGLGAPVLVHSTHVYPEVPAALLAVVAARAILRIPGGPGPALLAVAGSAVALVLLKDRYTPVALGLLVWALLRWSSRRPAPAVGALIGLLGASAAILWANPAPGLFPNLERLPPWPGPDAALRSGLGLLADQEFGLLYYAPQWALALAGIPLLWRRHRHACLGLLGITAFYLLVLLRYRWVRWFGGWTPSPRFVLACMPLLAPFVAVAFDACRGRALGALHGAGLLWTTLLGFVLVLVPAWRYDDADGRARLLEVLGARLGLDLARFLPSLVSPTAWTWTLLLLGAAGGILLLRRGWRAPAVAVPRGGGDWLAPRPAAALAAGAALVWLGLAAVVPTWSLEGEALPRSSGGAFQSLDYDEIGWVTAADGWITERIVTWPGWMEIRVTAGAYTTTAEAPRLRVSLDGHPVGVRLLRAVPGYWVRGDYVARVSARFGRPVLRVELTGLLDDPAGSRFQHAYVDRIRFSRLDAAGRQAPEPDCATAPLRGCPDAPVSRGELAELVLRARSAGEARAIPALKKLVAEGIVTPCDPEPLCAESAVSRRELAAILLRAMHGRDFLPPAVPPRFRDVAPDDPLAPWIQALGARELTCGCGPRSYCPGSPVTWRQVVQFLGRAFPGSHPAAPCQRAP